ncbi:MAG: electron transfer flavoprotein subunit alpha/FixB family protein [Oligoflexia bacterium]|nr:electron transfer flavoprotein subunit alpha/FixB family protein [Oligoflexia bacterium]
MKRFLVFSAQQNIQKSTYEIWEKLIAMNAAAGSSGVWTVDFLLAFRWQDRDLGQRGQCLRHGQCQSNIIMHHWESGVEGLKKIILEGNYDYVLSTTDTQSKEIFPRLAVELDAATLTEVVDMVYDEKNDDFIFSRPLFTGKILATVRRRKKNGTTFVTVRTNSFSSVSFSEKSFVESLEGGGALTDVNVVDPRITLKEVRNASSEKRDRINLMEAKIIVAGGRGLGSRENFKILNDLVDVLGQGASLGASRAAVDAGLADNSMQIGQTGKSVSPSLYIACGISGAIQHFAGMRTSKMVLAINSDPHAPIFSRADYGIVGDLFAVVPLLTEEIKSFSSF